MDEKQEEEDGGGRGGGWRKKESESRRRRKRSLRRDPSLSDLRELPSLPRITRSTLLQSAAPIIHHFLVWFVSHMQASPAAAMLNIFNLVIPEFEKRFHILYSKVPNLIRKKATSSNQTGSNWIFWQV